MWVPCGNCEPMHVHPTISKTFCTATNENSMKSLENLVNYRCNEKPYLHAIN